MWYASSRNTRTKQAVWQSPVSRSDKLGLGSAGEAQGMARLAGHTGSNHTHPETVAWQGLTQDVAIGFSQEGGGALVEALVADHESGAASDGGVIATAERRDFCDGRGCLLD